MTHFNLPEEVLSVVFAQLNNTDLWQCQQVCSSWYFPAHKVFLKKVCLQDAIQIEQFINSIDHNPNPQYLAAVKQIIIREDHRLLPVQYRLSKEHIRKLFFRFLNLENVEYEGEAGDFTIFSEFNDELCTDLINNCPRIHILKVKDCHSTNYYGHLLKLRNVLTDITLKHIRRTTHENNIISYLANFNRLKSLEIDSGNLNTFEKLLPVFEQLPNLIKLVVTNWDPDRAEFAEQYLTTRAINKHQLLERLSKITDLTWENSSGICINAIKFISTYLTGLKRLSLEMYFVNDAPSKESHQTYCNGMLDLFNSRSVCYLTIDLAIDDLSECLKLLLPKVYDKSAMNSNKRIFHVLVNHCNEDENTVMLDIRRELDGERAVLIRFDSPLAFRSFMATDFLETNSFNEFTHFILMGVLEYVHLDVAVYERMLHCMKSLKIIDLEIPSTFTEPETSYYTYIQDYDEDIYPQLEEMSIKAFRNVKYQYLLNRFSFAYPNISRLNFYYNCGYWDQQLGRFQLLLDNYSLKHLEIDITPIARLMHRCKQVITVEDFFLMDINFLNTNERQSYKVTPCSLSHIRLSKDELRSFETKKNHYIWFFINVYSLEKLKLCVAARFKDREFWRQKDDYLDSADNHITRVITFNE